MSRDRPSRAERYAQEVSQGDFIFLGDEKLPLNKGVRDGQHRVQDLIMDQTQTGGMIMADINTIDLDDTSQCPIEEACIGCGSTDGLSISTIGGSMVGVFCVTFCPTCKPGSWGPVPLSWAVRRVLAHCEHLGITSDTMAAIMDAEQ